jgi:hypothetical protein
MTEFWKVVTFASAWSAGWLAIPGYFATRAVYTGRIYDETSPTQWVSRAEEPVRFWRKVLFLYAIALVALVPWVMILIVGVKET